MITTVFTAVFAIAVITIVARNAQITAFFSVFQYEKESSKLFKNHINR